MESSRTEKNQNFSTTDSTLHFPPDPSNYPANLENYNQPNYTQSFVYPLPAIYPGPVQYDQTVIQTYPGQVYPHDTLSHQVFLQDQPIVVPPPVVSSVQSTLRLSLKEFLVYKYSKYARIAVYFNLLSEIFLGIYLTAFVAIALIHLIGIISTTRFHLGLSISYCIVILLLSVVKIVVIVIVPNDYIIGAYSGLMLVNIIVGGIFIRFLKHLIKLNDFEKNNCRFYYILYGRRCYK